MKTLIHTRVEQARNGENPTVICRVNSGWVVIGDVQVVRGYCLLLPDPVVESLNDLSREKREECLYEMSVIGDALMEITGCDRVNYEILGNTDPALHIHIFPRYGHEPDGQRQMPVWFCDWNTAPRFNTAEHADFMHDMRKVLAKKGVVAG